MATQSLNKKSNSKPHRGTASYGESELKTSKGIVVCKQCHNTYFKKQWHHPESKVKTGFKTTEPVSLTLCPACTMIDNHTFEGEIVINNVPKKYDADLINLITNYNSKSQKSDAQNRVIEIKKNESGYDITTTEDQMAVKLGKKINSAFKNSEISITYSGEPYEVARVVVTFSGK